MNLFPLGNGLQLSTLSVSTEGNAHMALQLALQLLQEATGNFKPKNYPSTFTVDLPTALLLLVQKSKVLKQPHNLQNNAIIHYRRIYFLTYLLYHIYHNDAYWEHKMELSPFCLE
jgi:hypothetical protein